MDRYGGDLELSAKRALVQCLDVLQLMDVGQSFGIDFSGGERIEHERVVRVRTVGNVDCRHDGGIRKGAVTR